MGHKPENIYCLALHERLLISVLNQCYSEEAVHKLFITFPRQDEELEAEHNSFPLLSSLRKSCFQKKCRIN